jgi:pimeloyl-ACP methyl ester carboxylesterase
VAGEFTVDEVAADALAVADDLGWDRFSVVGHSMGAKFAHRVLLAAPERVRALVGLNPVPAGATPFDEQGWALFSGAADNPGNRAAIIDFTTGNKLTKTFINRVVQHSLDHSTVEAFGAYLQAWARSDFSAQAKVDSATPVKLIVGVNDPALSADVVEQAWRVFFPEAELTILPDAGHYPMFESPVSLATSLEEFLGRP